MSAPFEVGDVAREILQRHQVTLLEFYTLLENVEDLVFVGLKVHSGRIILRLHSHNVWLLYPPFWLLNMSYLFLAMFKEQLVNEREFKYAPKTQETDEYGYNRENLNDEQGNRCQSC